MKKPLLTCCLVVIGAVAIYFGARAFDLGAVIMRLHGR